MTFRGLVDDLARRLLAVDPGSDQVAPGATPDETRAVLQNTDDALLALLDAADRVRRHFFGNEVRFCAILNARSGSCSEDCAFCAQSAHNAADAPAYPMVSADRVAEAARAAKAAGASEFSVVVSGVGAETVDEVAELAEAIETIRTRTGLRACVSAGILSPEALERMKTSGLARFHHNLESARSFYPSICTTREWEDNARAVRAAKAAGLRTCVGGIFGMGESIDQRVELLHQIAALDVESVPINFLHPIPGTPLAERPPLAPIDALRILAAARLTMPARHVVVCGGREFVLRELQPLVFFAGADGLMIGDYLTTKGRPADRDRQLARDLGLKVKAP